MDRSDPEFVTGVRTQHEILARNYELHGPKIEKIWRDMNQSKRKEVFDIDGDEEGELLGNIDGDEEGELLGKAFKLMPEFNTHNITTGPDFLLDHLKHRATTTLIHQYKEGVHDGPGDCSFIFESTLRIDDFFDIQGCKYSLIRFYNDDIYGHSFSLTPPARHSNVTTKLAIAFRTKAIVPGQVGLVVLLRQYFIMSSLNALVKDILESVPLPLPQPEEGVSSAPSNLSQNGKEPPKTLEDPTHEASTQICLFSNEDKTTKLDLSS
ncbi:hypothetical protein NHQ30_007722 [Ciborinia camelliae]|nr:hypothetical protein NHQ30_007722 [Ciborinia camelliae]